MSELVPKGLVDELSIPRPISIWWLQPAEGSTEYRVIGRTVVERMDVTRIDDVEHLMMHPDLAKSFGCMSTMGKSINASLREYDFAGSRLFRISDDDNKILAHAVACASPVRLGKTIPMPVPSIVASPQRMLIKDASEEFKEALRKPVNDPLYHRKEDTKNIISGVALYVFGRLKTRGYDEIEAYAAVIEIDPVMAGAGQIQEPASKVIADPDVRKQFSPAPADFGEPNDEDVDYIKLTPGSLEARVFSTPLGSSDFTHLAQRAEDVHQEILRKLAMTVSSSSNFETYYNKFADLVLMNPGQKTPSHILEIKSITSENLETQLSKGVIQLARRQYAHRGASIKYHLVVEQSEKRVPSYLSAIIRRMDIQLHLFNNSLEGQDSCQSLYLSIRT
jgi:hypothetical protein